MDIPCLSNWLYIVKQQSFIDLKRTWIETLGDRKHTYRLTANEYLHCNR